MPTEQYHEPPGELAEEVRTFARMITSLIEEAEAIGWYAQRLAVEADPESGGDHGERPGRGVQALRDGSRVPPAPDSKMADRAPDDPLPRRRHRRERRARGEGRG